MARLTPITSKDQVAAKDQAIVDSIVASRGALQGPFTMFLHSPELAGRLAHLGAYVRFEGSLDMRVRVLAAMTVARELEAVYVWGAQGGGARRRGAERLDDLPRHRLRGAEGRDEGRVLARAAGHHDVDVLRFADDRAERLVVVLVDPVGPVFGFVHGAQL